MKHGIYTLANDDVYDQLVALLNSIEVNVGSQIPVCVIPYDERLDTVRAEVSARNNVTLLEDQSLFAHWDRFATQVWQAHGAALRIWHEKGHIGRHRFGVHRRLCAFDGPFEKFVYLDADTLVFNSLKQIFEGLTQHDFVVYDFQYKHPEHVYNLQSRKLFEIFTKGQIDSEIFCSGFFASRREILDDARKSWLLSKLQEGEADILYIRAPDQSVLNYIVMRLGIPIYNLALHLPQNRQTGCCVTSSHFEARDSILYDKGNRLTYLHYIGLSPDLFRRLCAGVNIDFPYRDIFLHYRYLHKPQDRPQLKGRPKPYNERPSLARRLLRKLALDG